MIVLKIIFYIVLAFWLLGLLGRVALRYLLYRAKKSGGAYYTTYSWGGTKQRKEPHNGDVDIDTSKIKNNKKINSNVGEYVDYEEVKE